MLKIKPFCALRPRPDLCPQVASVPYDVLDRHEAFALAHNNSYSFLHVSRSEIDLPETTDPYSREVYQKAAANFAAMQKSGILIRDSRPFLYIYRLKRNARYQHGIVACCHAGDYEKNIIKKHEKTRIEKEEDRKNHTVALRAHSGPVFLIFRDEPDIDNLTHEAEQQTPLYDFTAPDGVEHTVWPAPKTDALIEAFKKIPAAYIADGHHRAAAGVRIAKEFSLKEGKEIGSAEYNWFLAVLFPASQLEILPYNRCVSDLNGYSGNDFLAAVGKNLIIEKNAPPSPARSGKISMFMNGSWFGLSPREAPPPNDVVAQLDVSILQNDLFEPVLGIKDPRTDKRLDFIGGMHGTKELENRVNTGKAAVAFSMFPASVSQLLSISDAGQIMPPKSTWFEPKLRDALLIHTF